MELAVCSRLLGDPAALTHILEQHQQQEAELPSEQDATATLESRPQEMHPDQSHDINSTSSSSEQDKSSRMGAEQQEINASTEDEGALDAAAASWLTEQVLARFPESRGEALDLSHWFGSADVALYLKVSRYRQFTGLQRSCALSCARSD